nr:hypothetical protein [Tanacetum cinerariifolium]GFA05770.1 hypothetical protein [Tanacetum cinerariifolium]
VRNSLNTEVDVLTLFLDYTLETDRHIDLLIFDNFRNSKQPWGSAWTIAWKQLQKRVLIFKMKDR